MEEITVSDSGAHSLYITYLYNMLAGVAARTGAAMELALGERPAVHIFGGGEELREELKDRITEIIGIGYKSEFLREHLKVALSKRDKKLLLAALIAADFEGDKNYIRRRVTGENCNIDGLCSFRLASLKEKWLRISEYVPDSFAAPDLKQFCEFLVEESRTKIYLKGRTVFGENFKPLRRSVLMGEEDAELEIMLSDAGFVYCLGDIEEGLSDFLQKFYAERAIFS